MFKNLKKTHLAAIALSIFALAVYFYNHFYIQSSSIWLDLFFRSANLVILLLIIYGFAAKPAKEKFDAVIKTAAEPYYHSKNSFELSVKKVDDLVEERRNVEESYLKLEPVRIEAAKVEAAEKVAELNEQQKTWEKLQRSKHQHQLDEEKAKIQKIVWQQLSKSLITDYQANPKAADEKTINNLFNYIKNA